MKGYEHTGKGSRLQNHPYKCKFHHAQERVCWFCAILVCGGIRSILHWIRIETQDRARGAGSWDLPVDGKKLVIRRPIKKNITRSGDHTKLDLFQTRLVDEEKVSVTKSHPEYIEGCKAIESLDQKLKDFRRIMTQIVTSIENVGKHFRIIRTVTIWIQSGLKFRTIEFWTFSCSVLGWFGFRTFRAIAMNGTFENRTLAVA